MNPPALPDAPGAWGAFKRAHLFDYGPGALRVWFLIVVSGATALAWALFDLTSQPPSSLWAGLAGLTLVGLAAAFPIRMPGTHFTVLVADIFIFAILATLGPAMAILAAGMEGLIGALRTSRRVSSHFSAPAAHMAAMGLCATAYMLLRDVLGHWQLEHDALILAALCLAAPLQTAASTGALFAMIAAKRGQRLRAGDWLSGASGVGAMSLGSAFLAGLLHLNAARFGTTVLVVAALVVMALVLLLRLTTQRQEAERQAQEAAVSDAQREAERSQQRFMAAFQHAAVGMAIVRSDGQVLQVNQAFCDLLQQDASALIARPFVGLLHAGDAASFRRRAEQALMRPEDAFSMELRTVTDQGEERWVAIHCSQYEDPGEQGHCLIYQLHDVTARHLAESQLLHIAYHDGLTELANRNAFNGRLAEAVERTRLDAGVRFAVLFLDLDRFKMVNDSLGHLAGNQLLREVAQRLQACVRPKDLVARLGGDEFAILLEDLHDPALGLRLAQRVLEALRRPMALNGTEVIPGASVGITFSDLGYRTVDEVLRDADLAMYEAKAGGRGRVAVFDSSMHDKVVQKLALEADLRHAIGEGQLTLEFQPMFELEPYRLCGFEALARWVHPQRGPVNPAVFIALAEESGHIEALTDWIIDQALAHLAQWHRTMPASQALGMHINISGRDLARGSLVAHVQQTLQRYAVAAGSLTLEITETTLMGRLDVALQTMGRLREMGVHFSIDDFGTGYSSLSYLGTLPIDSLKIDRSFVMGMQDSPQNVEIVRAVLNLGLSLGRRVIAEGIETHEQLNTLRRLGVPVGQGYLLSRPLGAEQVKALLTIGCPPLSEVALSAPALR